MSLLRLHQEKLGAALYNLPMPAPATLEQLDPDRYYTYIDYMSWTFSERVELLLGKLRPVGPSPDRQHQTISSNFCGNMFPYFQKSGHYLFFAPFDVRLPVSLKIGKVDTVVQPDICVICDKAKLDEQGCYGTPDLIVEILSPGIAPYEMREKFTLYELAGVREYWLVLPAYKAIIPYILNDRGSFIGLQPKTHSEQLISHVFPELSLNLTTIFAYQE